ncbi:hypothetical protein GGI12_005072, partial [Dipsacomyces acuminosporus]
MHYSQGWDAETVKRIFQYFCKDTRNNTYGVRRFIELLPPAATAYLEETYKGTNELAWVSNIDLIISLSLSTKIKGLKIDARSSGDLVDIRDALDSFGFNYAYWNKVIKLDLFAHGLQSKASLEVESDDMATSVQLSDYFGNYTPNIQYLVLRLDSKKEVNRLFACRMVNRLWKSIYVIDTEDMPITFSTNSVGENITHLCLTMNTDITNRLPTLMASKLQALDLHGVPEHFSWNAFYGDSPTTVVFAKLQELKLHFKSETVSEYLRNSIRDKARIMKVINQDANGRQLRFPKLQSLQLWNNPYSDSSFYTVFEKSPVKELIITGSFKSVKNINSDMLRNIAELDFSI